ncbi:hypothetical protein JIQ42_06102 [Leishmania sp. Namibia]|uniref:hypothetical protein n=1 Tax=Leishmania sp. Namibia TaxID=2802991 RepID=UPI001B5A48C5|nr:hypothetical protein JIQ42_06102 [Leishmania sp. Namibia]
MGCANQKLHAQQIAYQRDYLGACWNSVFEDDEAKEYLASRWMGISRQVMGLYTNNHCFTVRALSKEENTATVDPSKAPVSASGDPTGARPGCEGKLRSGSGGRQSSTGGNVSRTTSNYALLLCSDRIPRSNSHTALTAHAESPPTTVHQGQSTSCGYPNPANDDIELVAANAHIAAVSAGKVKSADSGALRTVMKDANELEKASHSHHPYLQRHELSVYSGVVFRCAPAHRLYHRISFVPAARVKRLRNAPLSGAMGSWQDERRQSAPPTPLAMTSGVGSPSRDRSLTKSSRSPCKGSGSGGKRSPLCEGDSGQASGMPALHLGISVAQHRSFSEVGWARSDPLSSLNNYPIEDRDVDGVAATRPPVVVGSITAMELQALPPNAELCFGGWLYVSLQDEQERLRRSLARYEARRQRRAVRREAAAAASPMVPLTRETLSTAGKDNHNQRQSRSGWRSDTADGENADHVSDGGEEPLLRASVTARWMPAPPSLLDAVQKDDPAPPPASASSHSSVDEDRSDTVMADTEDEMRDAAATANPLPVAKAAGSHVDRATRQHVVPHTPQLSTAPSEEHATPAAETATALPSPQTQASFSVARSLNLSGCIKASASSSAYSPAKKGGERLNGATGVPPSLSLRSSPQLTPRQHTGKYAQEAMEADTLLASWLPYAYVIIAIPMYECSLVPTAFHTAFTRCRAVSLNLADAQSRQAYGVGCITAARYGGVMVVEYREKISEDEDAEWIDELLRVGRTSQQRYGEMGTASGDTGCQGLSAPPAARASTPLLRHFSHTAAHHARAEKLHRIKNRICNKLRRQGLYVVLASTRLANRRHWQQCASVSSELHTMFPKSASSPGTPAMRATAHSKGRKSGHNVAFASFENGTSGDDDEGGVSGDYGAAEANDVVDYDSLNNSSSSSDGNSSSARTGRASRSSGGGGICTLPAGSRGADGGRRRLHLWSQLSSGGGSDSRRHRRRHRCCGNHGDGRDVAERARHHTTYCGLSGQRSDSGGLRGPATLRDPCPWAESGYDDDFLLRGTYRQIGGMKYLDVVSLIDGCPVSELVQGIKRWVVNLLSMPIKARPLSLYLQRYEGIASSLKLLSTQLARTALTTNIASGNLIAPANLSFHAGGGAGFDEMTASFVSQQHAEAIGGAVSTGSFSAASVALMSATAATPTVQAAPRGVQYNTYYRGPLDPVVQAVLSPEVELMIAGCQARQLPEVLRSPQLTAAHGLASDGAANVGPVSPSSYASAARRGDRDGRRGSGCHSSPTPPFLRSMSSSEAGRAVSSEAGAAGAAQAQCNLTLPTQMISKMPRTELSLCVDAESSAGASADQPTRQEQRISPTGSAGAQRPTADTGPLSATPHPSATLPATVSLHAPKAVPPQHRLLLPSSEATECFARDNPSRNGCKAGNSFTSANGRVSARETVAVLGGSINNATGLSAVDGSLTSPLTTASPSFRMSHSGTVMIDSLVVPSLEQEDVEQRVTLSPENHCLGVAAANGGTADGGTPADDTAEGEKRRVNDSVSNMLAGSRSTPKGANHPPRDTVCEPSATGCHDGSGENGAPDKRDGDAASPWCMGEAALAGAEEEEASDGEREWQLADRELRALKSELDEMHYLVSTARSELLERLEESIQLGAIFLPHTRPDQVDLSLLSLKMMRQYPEEVPVKEIHTDWVPMLMSLLTIPRESLFCCTGGDGDGLEHPIGGTWGFLKTYNNAVMQSDICDDNKRRELYDAGTTKYTINPLPPLPPPRPLHDIVIAPRPIRFTKAMLQEMKRVGMHDSGLSFAFSGGSLGVLAGVLYYYADFLRAKYRREVEAAGGRPKDAGATMQDVLARGGYNVVLRRIWIWGGMPARRKHKSRIASAAAKTKHLIRGTLPRRNDGDSASSTESTSSRSAETDKYLVTNTTGLHGGGVRVRGQPFRSAEAYALYDAIVHYLGTLAELHMEHQGTTSLTPYGPVKCRSVVMVWRRNRSGPGAAATADDNTGEANGAIGRATASLAAVEFVPNFEICVATNYYYKEMMEEARRPCAPARRSSSPSYASGDHHHACTEAAVCNRPSGAATSPSVASKAASGTTTNAAVDYRKAEGAIRPPSPRGKAGDRAKIAKEKVERAHQQLEQPYCAGEETIKKAPQRHAVKKIFGFLTDHYEQWRAQYSEDLATSALAKRVRISIR